MLIPSHKTQSFPSVTQNVTFTFFKCLQLAVFKTVNVLTSTVFPLILEHEQNHKGKCPVSKLSTTVNIHSNTKRTKLWIRFLHSNGPGIHFAVRSRRSGGIVPETICNLGKLSDLGGAKYPKKTTVSRGIWRRSGRQTK